MTVSTLSFPITNSCLLSKFGGKPPLDDSEGLSVDKESLLSVV